MPIAKISRESFIHRRRKIQCGVKSIANDPSQQEDGETKADDKITHDNDCDSLFFGLFRFVLSSKQTFEILFCWTLSERVHILLCIIGNDVNIKCFWRTFWFVALLKCEWCTSPHLNANPHLHFYMTYSTPPSCRSLKPSCPKCTVARFLRALFSATPLLHE